MPQERGEKLVIRTEVRVVLDAGGRAGGRGVVGARAAVGVVGRVAEAGDASRLAADDGAARVGGARKLSGAVGVEVDGAVCDGTALVVVNADGDVEAIDERDCEPGRSVLRTRQDTALRG